MKDPQPQDILRQKIDKILNKYVSNYNLDVLGFRESGQAKVIQAILSLLATHTKAPAGMGENNGIDENSPFVAAGNIVNDILIAHRDKWNGDDEIQDMCVESFLMGVKYWQDNG